MTETNDAEKLAAIEAEWKARQAVEQAHAKFHIKPSEAAAQRLSDAIEAWRVTSGLQRPQAAAELDLERAIETALGMDAIEQWADGDYKGAAKTVADAVRDVAGAETLEREADAIIGYCLDLSTPEATRDHILAVLRRDARLLRGERS